MAGRFHTLTISDVTRETPDAVSITLDVPEEVRPLFLYKAGQHVTVKATINGTEHRRNYSLCSSPVLDEPLRIAVKRVHDGAVSQWLNEHAARGMNIEVYPPMGNFTKEMSVDHERDYVMFAGGSGITPVMSIIKTILRVEPKSTVTLVYANRNAESIIFASDLTALSLTHKAFRVVHVLEDTGDGSITSYEGRMDAAMMQRIVTDHISSFEKVETFVCGPAGMMESVVDSLHNIGLDNTRIHREYFVIERHETQAEDTATTTTISDVIVKRKVKIRMYGDEHEFDVEPDETILSAAQRANLDPPYACQIGACCTCRAKITSGKVKMDEREALSDDEIEDGYALTCQSHPLTDNVVADYDK